MIPGLELLACQDLAVPMEIMEHVVRVESSFNPFAIGVVGARLARQPRNLEEAVATASRLERDGYNFSLGLAQVNRHNLATQGLSSYELAFDACPNLAAGARILADCHMRADGDWDKAFSCYYSGNFSRGFRDGYVEKIRRSMSAAGRNVAGMVLSALPLAGSMPKPLHAGGEAGLVARRMAAAAPAAALAALSDPSAGVPGMSLPADTQDAGGVARSDAGNGIDDAPFVPQVTGPGARQSFLPPSPPRGTGDDASFVF